MKDADLHRRSYGHPENELVRAWSPTRSSPPHRSRFRDIRSAEMAGFCFGGFEFSL